MDNRVFDFIGRTDEQLLMALELAMLNEYGESISAKGWMIDQKKGLILFEYLGESKSTAFPSPLGAEELFPLIKKYLSQESTWQNTDFSEFEVDLEHDGDNEEGFRIYTENFGGIQNSNKIKYSGSFLAIKPCYCWYGK